MEHAALTQLLAYHHWATDRLLDAVRALPAEALAQPLGGSFGTGRGLLGHLLGAEQLWVERWQGRSPASMPDVTGCETAEQFALAWEATREAQRRVLRGRSDATLAAPLTYTNLRGETNTYPFSAVVLHLVNHGTYHRGQLAHLLRQLGQVPPSTDYLLFLNALG